MELYFPVLKLLDILVISEFLTKTFLEEKYVACILIFRQAQFFENVEITPYELKNV